MTVTVNLDPAQMPLRTQEQTIFDALMASFMQNLPVMVAQINATEANMAALALGGAFAANYLFDSSTVNGDPGPGKLRFNSALMATVSTAYPDNVSSNGQNMQVQFDTWNASTSPTKGYVKFAKQSDASRWALFRVTSTGALTGYYQLALAFIASSSSAPFAAGDPVVAQFTPTGDAGVPGAYPTFRVQDQKSSGTSGGQALQGINTRTLNTATRNTLAGASLSNNQVTLPAGTYKVTGSAPARGVTGHQAGLYSVTGSAYLLVGTPEYSDPNYPTASRSFLVGEITLATATVLELRHWTNSGTATTGFGAAIAGIGVSIYSEIVFEKVG